MSRNCAWNEQNLLSLPFSDLRQTLDKVSLQQPNGLIRLNGYLLHCVPMRCIYVNSAHHVTCEDDYSAGLVWSKDKIEHFIVSPRSLDGIRAVHQLHFFNRTGALVTPYFFIHSFFHSFTIISSDLQKPLCALGQIWNVSVTVHLTLCAASDRKQEWMTLVLGSVIQ